MTAIDPRPEVVQALLEAHLAPQPAMALAGVEHAFTPAPTPAERAEAHRLAVDAGNDHLRRLIDEVNDERS